MTYTTLFGRWLLVAMTTLATTIPCVGLAQSRDIDPEAIDLLARSTVYVAGTKQFSMEADSTLEVVLATGQKLQLGTRMAVTLQRPNKMRAERVGEIVDQTFLYDGKTLVMHLPEEKAYASIAAPPTLDEMLNYARDTLGVIAPGADLVTEDAFEVLIDGLTSAFVVGDAMVDGVLCDHLAFRNAEVDWQLWVAQGDKPLPMKYVITSKRMPESPQFVVQLSKWNTAPKITDKTFVFKPPKGSTQIEFIPVDASNPVTN